MLRQVQVAALALFALAACDGKKEPPHAAVPPPAAAAPAAKPAPPAQAPAPAGETPARVETDTYVVMLSARPGGGTVTITAKPPLHVNAEYPLGFKPEPGGVAFESERVALSPSSRTPCEANAEDACEVVSPLAFTASAGDTVSGTVLFSVCEPEKCLIEKVKLAAVVR